VVGSRRQVVLSAVGSHRADKLRTGGFVFGLRALPCHSGEEKETTKCLARSARNGLGGSKKLSCEGCLLFHRRGRLGEVSAECSG